MGPLTAEGTSTLISTNRMKGIVCALTVCALLVAAAAATQELPPELTRPVNDFASVIDPQSEQNMEALIRSLQQASGDVVVVATVQTFKPYGDIREYAVKMFENHGRGIGQRGKDNGVLILLAVNDRQVWIEVGYDLEQFVTDGFAGETSRQYMAPEFRQGNYGPGLQAGLSRIVARIIRTQSRNAFSQFAQDAFRDWVLMMRARAGDGAPRTPWRH